MNDRNSSRCIGEDSLTGKVDHFSEKCRARPRLLWKRLLSSTLVNKGFDLDEALLDNIRQDGLKTLPTFYSTTKSSIVEWKVQCVCQGLKRKKCILIESLPLFGIDSGGDSPIATSLSLNSRVPVEPPTWKKIRKSDERDCWKQTICINHFYDSSFSPLITAQSGYQCTLKLGVL